jgi:RNA polymerase sigma-70 factor (ECF subfamily)
MTDAFMRTLSFFIIAIIVIVANSALADEQPPISLDSVPPVVVKTVPAAGADDVDPGLNTIRVTFSKKMRDGSWSWVQMSKDTFPTMRGKPRYLKDGRTNVLDVTLKPNQTYAIWLNTDKFQNFVDTEGRPAVPYLLVFKTGVAREKALDAEVGREGSQVRFSNHSNRTIIDINSEFGIDKATIRRKSDEWPKPILVRLHLGGLESFKAGSGDVAVEWSVSSTGDHTTRMSLWKEGGELAIPKNSPYHTELRIVGGNGNIPLKEGYFEILLPARLFRGNPEEITLRWIDFYRN